MRVRIRNEVSSYEHKNVILTSKFILITDLTEDEEIFHQLCKKVFFRISFLDKVLLNKGSKNLSTNSKQKNI